MIPFDDHTKTFNIIKTYDLIGGGTLSRNYTGFGRELGYFDRNLSRELVMYDTYSINYTDTYPNGTITKCWIRLSANIWFVNISLLIFFLISTLF